MLTQNKISKYLLYAIGEIILVVIGILIALQVNSWNEKRKSNFVEKAFIKNIIIDLKSDVITLNKTITYNQEKSVNLDSVLTYVNKNINDLSNHDALYGFIWYSLYTGYSFNNQNRTLNSLSSLDNGVIRQNVADSIAGFQQKILEIQKMSQAYDNALEDARPISFKLISLYYQYDNSFVDQNTKIRTGVQLPKLKSDTALQHEFFNYVAWARGITGYYVESFLKSHLNETKEFIKFLEVEYSIEN